MLNVANRTLFTGDNLDVMRGINSACIDLIYLDPPFNSNADYAAPIGSEAAGAAFKDTWTLDDIDLAWHGQIAEDHRTDIPARTDVYQMRHYDNFKNELYGRQEGKCAGCQTLFEFRNLEVDHIIPRSRGGQDNEENLQLLCSFCNRTKGDRPMEYLLAKLGEVR